MGDWMCRHVLWGLILPILQRTVSCQSQVSGYIGDTVLLPCICSPGLCSESSTVLWRDKDDRNVLDIIKGKENLNTQDQKFKGRVSFPSTYVKGNFSIKMKNIMMEDAGTYECVIPPAAVGQKVSLVVSGKRVEAVAPPPGPPPHSGGAVVTTSPAPVLLFCLLLFSLFFCLKAEGRN